MTTAWTADSGITADSGFTADGSVTLYPKSGSYHYLSASGGRAWQKSDGTYYELNTGPQPNMPDVTGVKYPEAQWMLEQTGVLNLKTLGYFTTFPVSAIWEKSASPPSTVLSQYPSTTMYLPVNGPIILTMAEYPFSVVFP